MFLIILKKIKSFIKGIGKLGKLEIIEEENKFLIDEIQRLNELLHHQIQTGKIDVKPEAEQTKSSFDYQWGDIPEGIATQNTPEFLAQAKNYVLQLTDLPADWFGGKTVADVGCGYGRFSQAFLALGAQVYSYDQSDQALKNTTAQCQKYGHKFRAQKIDILNWNDDVKYDLVFSFGVLHHTGNTYRAIEKTADKVKPGGRLFLMIYGYPDNIGGYKVENLSRELRRKFKSSSFPEIKKYLIDKYGLEKSHSLFDAVSPHINDLLTFEELKELLGKLGFHNIRRTVKHRNHRLIADKK